MTPCPSSWLLKGWRRLTAVVGLALFLPGHAQQQPVFPGTEEPPSPSQPVFPGTEETPATPSRPFPGTEDTPATAEGGAVIPVTDLDALRAKLKETVLVRGTVREVTTGRSGYKRVHFHDTTFFLYIAKKDLDRFPDWKPEEWQGRNVFARGQVSEYRSQLELIIRAPSDLAASAEALPPSFSPAAATSRVAKDMSPGTSSSSMPLEPKRTSTEVSQVLARLDVPQPYLAFERFKATFDTGFRSTAPLILESYSGRDRSPALAGVEVIRTRHGWPARKILRVTRSLTDGAPGPGLPHSFAVALMVEAMLQDIDLPATLAVGGHVQPDGTLAGGREEIMMLPTPPPPEGSLLLLPEAARSALIDLALDEQWEVLTRYSILGAKTLDDAARLTRLLSAGAYAEAIERFASLGAELGSNPAQTIRSPTQRSRLQSILTSCPEHLTAQALLELSTSREGPRYSAPASAIKLRLFYAKLADTRLSKAKSKEEETRRKLRELKNECRALGNKIDPSCEEFHTALKGWLDAMEVDLRFSANDDSARAKKVRRELGARAEQAKKLAEAVTQTAP